MHKILSIQRVYESITFLIAIIYEPSHDFKQSDSLTSVHTDEPVQPPVKLGNSK